MRLGGDGVGLAEQAEHQVGGEDLVVAGRVGLVVGGHDRVAGPRREAAEAPVGVEVGRDLGPLGRNRLRAACLVTPIARPMSVHEAPDRRAWSTKCPMRWSATSPR